MLSAKSTDTYNINAAINYLNGNNVEGALNELKAAVNYSNEEARVEAIQRSLTPAQWAELNALHGEEIKDIRNDLDGVDQEVFDALASEGDAYLASLDKKPAEVKVGEGAAKADALRLRERMGRDIKGHRGDKGADAAADTLSGAARGAGDDVLSGKDALDLDERSIESEGRFDMFDAVGERNKQQWDRTKVAFDKLEVDRTNGKPPAGAKAGWSIAAFASEERKYQVWVHDSYSEHGGHIEVVPDKIRSEQTKLIQTIVDYGPDSDEVGAARLDVEFTRPGGPKPERLDAAMHSSALDAREGEDKSKLSKEEKEKRIKQAQEKQRRVLVVLRK